jgi:hypothetical protein
VRFVFSVRPMPPTAPLVHLLGETPHKEATLLSVNFDPASELYTVALVIAPEVGEARLEIELVDATGGLLDLHGATLAVREHAIAGPMSRSSTDGNFAVYTTPDGLPSKARLLIAGVELPLEGLPSKARASDVLSVYSVLFTGAADVAPSDWRIAVSDSGAKAPPPSLLFLARGGKTWTNTNGVVLPGHSLVVAKFAGQGTYLLLRGVWP